MSRPAEQIIGPSVMHALRTEYEEMWGSRWPHGRRKLAELVIQAKQRLGLKPNNKTKADEVQIEALALMRKVDHLPDQMAFYGTEEVVRPITLRAFQA